MDKYVNINHFKKKKNPTEKDVFQAGISFNAQHSLTRRAHH